MAANRVSFLRQTLGFVTIGMLLSACGQDSHPLPNPTASAPCFNDGGEHGAYGVWIYQGYDSWQQAREAKPPTLCFAFTPGKDRYELSELQYCFYVLDARKPILIGCKSGHISIEQNRPREELIGRYELTLEDGTQKVSRFVAPYCPMSH